MGMMSKIKTGIRTTMKNRLRTAIKNTAVSTVTATAIDQTRQRLLIPAFHNWCRGQHKSLVLGMILRKLAGR